MRNPQTQQISQTPPNLPKSRKPHNAQVFFVFTKSSISQIEVSFCYIFYKDWDIYI